MKIQVGAVRATAIVVAAVAVSLALSACNGGADSGDGRSSQSQPDSSNSADIDLVVSSDDGEGNTNRAKLRCDGDRADAEGFGDRDAKRLCRTAERLRSFLAAEPERDRGCIQVYGGPETARIRGTIKGREVDRRFARNDGCAIADWDRAAALLPAAKPVGAPVS